MVRPLRIDMPVYSNITVRGNARQDIFFDAVDRLEFLSILSTAIDRNQC